ncbi:MAG: LysR substrate-binding domain-containing protein [Mucilaginibacter sp.]|uniref:LysR substrate-binding domain-containing protein n=1 Tax=Mucilaginibacter sp. TaxID=1882438 RepID=UPI0031AD06C3
MDVSVLRNFITLAEELNFTRSSGKSFIAQPALSRQIKNLEDEVGAQLFIRNKRNVELTPAGKYFRDEVERMLQQYDYAVNRTKSLHRGESGVIRIGYTHSVMQSFLPGLIKQINDVFPDIRIILLEFNNARQYEALKDRDIDIGFSTNPEIPEGFKSKLMVRENFAVGLPRDHVMTSDSFRSLADLKNEKFILAPKREGPMYVALIESMFVEAGFLPQIVHETPFAGTSIRLVEMGVGLTIEPLSSLKNYPGIKVIELKDLTQKAEIVMLWQQSAEDNLIGVIDLIREHQLI